MYEGLDTVILNEELAYQDTMPVSWQPRLPDAQALLHMTEGNARLLQVCLALEEQPRKEKAEEAPAYAADIQRLDLKMNLLLDLMGRVLSANHARPTATAVRFNVHGAIFRDTGGHYITGADGVLAIQPLSFLPESLCFAGRVAGTANDGSIKIKFAPVGETVADLIEKLAFRRHRRSVAGAKQPRKS